LDQFLEAQRGITNFANSRLIPEIKEHVRLSIEAAKDKLQMNKGSFELFGYDFIIDSELKSWLIEVNTNPCLETSSPLLEMLIPRMINDALRLTID
jgi:D-alanine-D-alanine ligase-like ATP-grasp enzyme